MLRSLAKFYVTLLTVTLLTVTLITNSAQAMWGPMKSFMRMTPIQPMAQMAGRAMQMTPMAPMAQMAMDQMPWREAMQMAVEMMPPLEGTPFEMLPIGEMMAEGMDWASGMAGVDQAVMMIENCSLAGAMESASRKLGARQAFEGKISQQMARILFHPGMTLKALECAKRNPDMVRILLDTLRSHPFLLGFMGGSMVLRPEIAHSMMDLAIQTSRQRYSVPPQFQQQFMYSQDVGNYLFRNLNPILFKQFTYAIAIHPGLVHKVLYLLELNLETAIQRNSGLLHMISHLGSGDNDFDGNELAIQRFIYYVFSDIDAADHMLKILQEAQQKGGAIAQGMQDLMAAIFSGRVIDYRVLNQHTGWLRQTRQLNSWTYQKALDNSWVQHTNQLHHNIYAAIYGLHKIYVEPMGDQANFQQMSMQNMPEKYQRLIKGFKQFIIHPQTHEYTPLGMDFMAAMTNGGFIKNDKKIQEIAIMFRMILSETPRAPKTTQGQQAQESPAARYQNPPTPAVHEILNEDICLPQMGGQGCF